MWYPTTLFELFYLIPILCASPLGSFSPLGGLSPFPLFPCGIVLHLLSPFIWYPYYESHNLGGLAPLGVYPPPPCGILLHYSNPFIWYPYHGGSYQNKNIQYGGGGHFESKMADMTSPCIVPWTKSACKISAQSDIGKWVKFGSQDFTLTNKQTLQVK